MRALLTSLKWTSASSYLTLSSDEAVRSAPVLAPIEPSPSASPKNDQTILQTMSSTSVEKRREEERSSPREEGDSGEDASHIVLK